MKRKPRVFNVGRFESDEEMRLELRRLGIHLTPDEVRKICDIVGRDPSIPELWIFNVEWSEHCSYKSSKRVLQQFLPTTGPNVIQGPEEDAGIVYLDTIDGEVWGLVIAHESHNHPSQVLPIEGAATGIGGIVRDVDCMGARVVAVADPLRFGDPAGENGVRTKWIANGVIQGIWEYGNALGVPNIAGDVVFSETFDDNCLVNVVCLGVVREKDIVHSRVPKEAEKIPYEVILVGKPTDSSGFGGAAFASEVLDEEQEEEKRGAVQVHDPFLKNVLLMRKANEAVIRLARDRGHEIGFKDLGGAGLACASSEMGADGGFGLEIDLDLVHQAEEGLLPEVIACAETQERYLLIAPKELTQDILDIYNKEWELPNIYEGARASVIGHVRLDDRYVLRHKGEVVCDLSIRDVARGVSCRRDFWPPQRRLMEPIFPVPKDLGRVLLDVLSSPNISSRSYIYRFYDTEVQGNTVIRPGEADAGVIAPLLDEGSKVGVALSVDGNPFYGRLDPYWGGATAVAEAMRNVACVGATPQGLTDCLNYGNPENPHVFFQFVEGVRGISDAASNIWLKGFVGTPVPVISGNVSFYNESAQGKAVDPSPIIACVGTMHDYSKAITMRFKREGSLIYLIGERYDELGGSEYYRVLLGESGRNVPKVDFTKERSMIYSVIDAVDQGLVLAVHDISNGGLAVALVEMILGGRGNGALGADVDLSFVPCPLRVDKKMFSESGGFLLEVPDKRKKEIEEVFSRHGVRSYVIGHVVGKNNLRIKDGEVEVLCLSLEELRQAWLSGIPQAMR